MLFSAIQNLITLKLILVFAPEEPPSFNGDSYSLGGNRNSFLVIAPPLRVWTVSVASKSSNFLVLVLALLLVAPSPTCLSFSAT